MEVRQENADTKSAPHKPLQIQPYDTCNWFKADYQGGTKIQIRCESSDWSYGCIDVNELGTSVLLLPQRGWFKGSANRDAVVAHVEVTTFILMSFFSMLLFADHVITFSASDSLCCTTMTAYIHLGISNNNVSLLLSFFLSFFLR